MNPYGLLRTLFASVLALVLSGGLMAAQAQDATRIVDEDGSAQGTDFQNIPDALDELESATGNSSGDTGTLVIFAGDYRTGANNSGDINFSRPDLPNLDIEVREDDVSGGGAIQLTLTQFQIEDGTDVALSGMNSSFVRVRTGGSSPQLDLDDGDLTVASNTRIEVENSGEVFRTADSEVTTNGDIDFTQGTLEYDLTNGDITAAGEAPSTLNGNLIVGGGQNTLTFPSDIQVNGFTYNDGNVTAQGDFSVASDFTVSSGDTFSLSGSGTLTFRNNNPNLNVAGTLSGSSATLEVLDFTSTSTSFADFSNTGILGGSGTVNIGTLSIEGVTNNDSDNTFQARVDVPSGGDFTIATVETPETTENNGANVDDVEVDFANGNGGTLSVGGTLDDVTNDDSGSSLTLTGTTITGVFNNGAGTATVTSDVTYDIVAAGSAIDNSRGGEIIIQNDNALTVDATGDDSGTSNTALNNSGPNGVTGDGGLNLVGNDGDTFTITTASGDPQILPDVASRRATTIQDATGGVATNITTGDLSLGNDDSRLGDGDVGDVTTGNVTAKQGAVLNQTGALIIGDGNSTVDDVSMQDVEILSGGSLEIGNASNGSTVGTVTMASLTTNGDLSLSDGGTGLVTVNGNSALNNGVVNFTNASGGPFDVKFTGNVTLNASSANNPPTELDISGLTVEMLGDFERAPDPQATLTTSLASGGANTELVLNGTAKTQTFDTGSLFTFNGLFRVSSTDGGVELNEALRVNGNVRVDAPGSPGAPNNTLTLRDNLFMATGTSTTNAGQFIMDGLLRTQQTDAGTKSFVVFEGGETSPGNGDSFEILRENTPFPSFTPEIGNFEVRGDAQVDITTTTNDDFDLLFAGTVNLLFGDLTVDSGSSVIADFSAASSEPLIVRRLDNETSLTTPNADDTFNDRGNPYDLVYSGNGDGSLDFADDTEEFQPANGSVANLTLRDDAGAIMTDNREATGDLFIDESSILTASGQSDFTLTLDGGNASSHQVGGAAVNVAKGFVEIEIAEQGATLSGDDGSEATLENLTVSGGATGVEVTDLRQIANNVTVNSGAGLSLGLRVTDSNNPSTDQNVHGQISSDGDLTLLSDVVEDDGDASDIFGRDPGGTSADGVVLGGGGSFAFGDNDLTVEDGDFSGGQSVTYQASSGTLFMDSGGSFGTSDFGTSSPNPAGNPDTDDGTVPRVEFNATTGLSSESSVSNVLTFDDQVSSGGNDLVFTGTANVNFANAFTGTGFLVSAGTTVNIADNDGDDDDLAPLPSSEASSSGSGVSPQQISISNPAQFSRFRVASGSGGTTEITSSGIAALKITDILDLRSGTLDHDLNIALTGDDSGFDELQTTSPGASVTQSAGSAPGGDVAGLIFNGNPGGSSGNFTLGLVEPLTVPNLEVASEASTAASSSGELTVGDNLFLKDQLLTSNASTGLTIANEVDILRTDYEGSDVLDQKPTFADEYDLEYQGSGDEFVSSFEVATSASALRDLTIDAQGGDVYLGTNKLTGTVTVNRELDLNQGQLDYGRQVEVADGATVRRTEAAELADVTDASPGDSDNNDPDPIEAEGTYALEYDGDAAITATDREFIDDGGTGIADVESVMDNSSTLTVDFDVTARNLTVNNGSGSTTDISGADLIVDNKADLNSGSTTLTSSGGTVATVTVDGETDVVGSSGTAPTLDIGSTYTANGPMTVGGGGSVTGNLLDANANLTVNGVSNTTELNALTFVLEGNLDLDSDAATDGSDATFDGEDNQGVNMTDLTPSGIDLEKMTLDQTVASSDYPRVEVAGGNVVLNGADNSDEEDVLIFDNGLLDVAEGQTPSANRVEIDNAEDGFDRSQVDFGSGNNVDGDDVGHVIGTYRQKVAGQEAAVYVAPVGSDVASRPKYRRYRLIFRGTGQDEVPIRDTQLDVEHVTANPQGTEGLPVEDATGLTVGSYPQYFWRISTTEGLGSGQKAEQSVLASDLEALFDDEENLRLIRRGDGPVTDTQWRLVGDGTSYDNFGDAQTEPDNTVRIRTQETEGSFEDIGVRLTVGAPGQLPSFTAAEYDSPSSPDRTIDEGETLTARFSASSGDFNQTLTSLDTADVPQDARDFITASNSIDGGLADTDTLTTDSLEVEFTPDNSFVDRAADGPSRDVQFTVRAEDQEGTVDSTFTVTVNDANRAPAITEALPNSPDTTIAAADPDDSQLLEQVYDASDPDGQDVNFSLTQSPSGVAFSNATPAPDTLEWTPSFSQAGASYTITAEASDGTATVDSTSTVEVVFDRLVGDVDGSGGGPADLFPGASGFKDPSEIGPDDAFRALEIAVGKNTMTKPDASGDATVGDPEIRAADCAPLADPSDPSQGCEGDDPAAADRGNVTPADAFAVLQVFTATGSGSQNAALASAASKSGSASGEIQVNEPEVKDGLATLPVVLSEDASGVTSAEVTLELNKDASLASVNDQLPNGWQVASHVQKDGTLKLGMFGPSALSGGEIATLQVDLGGSESVDGLKGQYRINTSDQRDLELQTAPSEFKLMGNYPNPVSRSTTIDYQLKETRRVKLEVYNTLGQKVATLVNEEKEAGTHEVTLDAASGANGLSSGVYFYRITAGDFTESKRMTVVR